jgi:ribosomal protein S18 acetylase RimI-like enzyme
MDARTAFAHRPQSAEDEDFVFRVYASTRDDVAAYGWPAAQLDAFLRMQFRARRMSYEAAFEGASHFILLCGDAQAGTAIVWRGANEMRLVDIALLPEYRGQGLGARWLDWLIEQASSARTRLRLSVLHGNPAINLYRRLGFLETGAGGLYIEMERRCE